MYFFMWQVIPREAREFGLGKMKYYMVLIWDAVFWQLVNIGLVGLISGASSLFVAMMVAFQLPLLEILSVVFLREKFSGIKGVSLLLSLWGFVSYMYGEKKQSDEAKKTVQQELVAVA
jgi:Purine nucleobase transmembrane transport